MSNIIYTKETLTAELHKIADMGWIENGRHGNHGGIGNTLEDLLGIEENNLPIPNAAEWELKAQKLNTTSLTTLFHIEPSPRALRFVPQILLPNFGWPHQEAGAKYQHTELSFRQTIHGRCRSDRGFKVVINTEEQKVQISFDYNSVSLENQNWLESVKQRRGSLDELDPQPYWGFDDLAHKAGTKLLNCFYVQAEVKKIEGKEYFKYSKVMMLKKFKFDGFLKALHDGQILIDFDARTGHNHGTKFRLKQNCLPSLYEEAIPIIG